MNIPEVAVQRVDVTPHLFTLNHSFSCSYVIAKCEITIAVAIRLIVQHSLCCRTMFLPKVLHLNLLNLKSMAPIKKVISLLEYDILFISI